MVHQIKNTEARVILVHPSLVKTAVSAADTAGLGSQIYLFSDEPNAPVDGIRDWREFLPTPSEADRWSWKPMVEDEAANTVATVNFSSGTTGLPKGVCVSHRNLIANVEQTIFLKYLNKPWKAHDHPPERWIGFLPLYHAYGQLWTILMATKLLVPVYVMKQFSFVEFLRTIQTYKVTHLQIAPPILVMLSKRAETAQYDLSSLTDCLCGAAPLSKELQNECSKRFGMEIVQGWGMTEVTCGAMHVPGGSNDE